ncbi:nucleotidyltransferase [Candidatus Uabimicrobium sp. HlEnr_7]|uniref:SMODS domain-containing nucleotidyltransferase n=1 Tax=Candidatus Uabimicrobium helgolandensis TaxID=3095367 RepID=UPI003557862E
MAKLDSSFREFLKEIRPTSNQKEDLKKGHTILRERLLKYEKLKSIVVHTFLQGSYKRATLVRPKGGKRSDVDVVVVTNLKKESYPDPNKAMDLFVPFLREYYKHKYKRQGRSFAIDLSYVDLDLVITSSPPLAQIEEYKKISDENIEDFDEGQWKSEQLWIPDRDASEWKPTHPLEQFDWTKQKNNSTNGHYTNVVKAIKWWQRSDWPNDRPKGYPLEHLIGQVCPDKINSVAEGIVSSFEGIVNRGNSVPYYPSYGVSPQEDVFARISASEYSKFYEHIECAAKQAREAFDKDDNFASSKIWRELFGDKFPKSKQGPFVTPKSSSGDLKPRRYGKTNR